MWMCLWLISSPMLTLCCPRRSYMWMRLMLNPWSELSRSCTLVKTHGVTDDVTNQADMQLHAATLSRQGVIGGNAVTVLSHLEIAAVCVCRSSIKLNELMRTLRHLPFICCGHMWQTVRHLGQLAC